MSPKPLLELKNIGKIYVSDNNVAVGIRGVNLTFQTGEFVAVTGKSGSGKSTLLNVISGMDSYEEGELLIEGEPTSHYLQRDWEEYRKQYISFIFQDYNIIESFTVLQNVELALFHIENPRERRKRAMDLIRRVGLEKHARHKGSKLSGGQKQRTVIARALAKDSPIILADEPTGNLDSQSSREIINLLREVSRDKLVIVVTHNFEEVEHCATRHIRVFDGAVELDHTLRTTPAPSPEDRPISPAPTVDPHKNLLRNGLLLGRTRFTARPKLSVFLCLLMTIAALVITLITAETISFTDMFEKTNMFTHVDGRVVIIRRDGAIITDDELEDLASELDARDFMHYDFMLDRTTSITLHNEKEANTYVVSFDHAPADYRPDAGRLPERDDEVILEVPISAKQYLSTPFVEQEQQLFGSIATYRIVGVKYFYDNTRTSRLLFTENGYKIASAVAFFSEQSSNFSYLVTTADTEDKANQSYTLGTTIVDFHMEPGAYYINSPTILKDAAELTPGVTWSTLPLSVSLEGQFYSYYYGEDILSGLISSEEYGTGDEIIYPFTEHRILDEPPAETIRHLTNLYRTDWTAGEGIADANFVVISPEILLNFMYEHYYAEAYTQASLFFDNDRAAHRMTDALEERGYVAVVTDETVEDELLTSILTNIVYIFQGIGWAISISFAVLFLSLCSSRAMNATRGDIGIMRSMGIPTAVVKISVYVQMLISLIPAAIVTAITCTVIYLLPSTNDTMTFLHLPEYLFLGLVLVLIASLVARRQVRRMFRDSVKKTLKGGNKA